MNKLIIGTVVAVIAVLSVPVGMVLWPPAAGNPPAGLMPVFVLISLVEGVAFGLGVVLLIRGITRWRTLEQQTGLGRVAYLSLVWLLLNWWPHDGLHRSAFGQNFTGLAVIDFTFHCSLIAATVIVAYSLIRALVSARTDREAEPDRTLAAR
jgi:TM2 domain-containing membrane protein YozV